MYLKVLGFCYAERIFKFGGELLDIFRCFVCFSVFGFLFACHECNDGRKYKRVSYCVVNEAFEKFFHREKG